MRTEWKQNEKRKRKITAHKILRMAFWYRAKDRSDATSLGSYSVKAYLPIIKRDNNGIKSANQK